MNTPHDDDFDQRAREAGRALRQAAPTDGLRQVQTARRNRRILQGAGALAVAVVGVGAAVALVTRGDDDGSIANQDPTVPVTTPAPTLAPAPSTVPATAPVVVPPTSPVSAAPTNPTPSTEPLPDGVQSVWVGEKLAGWYDGDTFVPYDTGATLPGGLLGTPVELVGLGGTSFTSTPTDAGCSSPYLASAAPLDWDVYTVAGAPLRSAPLDLRRGGIETPEGFVTDQVLVAELPGENLSGDQVRLVLVDGWNADYQYPTWIALFDPVRGEYTTIEGDRDPSNALDTGQPVASYVDLDGDGNWEIVFGLGDGWDVRELTTNESLVFGDGHPCPDPTSEPPPATSGTDALLGEWAFETESAAALFVTFDGTATVARYASCQDTVVEQAGTVGVLTQTPADCVPDDADPRLHDVHAAFAAGAPLQLETSATTLSIGDELTLTRLVPPTGLDLERGSAFGFYAGQYVRDVDALVDAVSAEIGEPTHDTGWFVTPPTDSPGEPDCLADMSTRSIWWGDFVISVWPDTTDMIGGTIWNWTLGAEASPVNVFADEPYTPTPSGLGTIEDLAPGMPAAAVPAYFGDRFSGWTGQGDVTQWGSIRALPPFENYNDRFFTATDGVLETIATQKTFC